MTNGLDAISRAVLEGGDLEVAEHVGHLALQLAQALDGELPDLDVGVLGGAHRDEVPPRPVVAGDDDAGLGGVGQHGPGGLPGLLAPQRGVRDVGEALLQPLQQLLVRLHRRRGGLREQRVQLRVVRDDLGLDHRGVALGHVALGELAVGEVPVPDQLVGERARHAGEVEAHRAVLEHREVPDLEDVPQVPRVGGGARVRLAPRLVAGPAGELGQRLAAVGVGAPRHVGGRHELRLGYELHLGGNGLRHGGSVTGTSDRIRNGGRGITIRP